MHETGRKGDIGVAAVTADLLEQGFEVVLPVSSCSAFDLGVVRGQRFFRVQVKYAAKKKGCVEVKLGRAVITSNGVRRRRFKPDEIDVVAVYCPDTRECYYVKARKVGAYARFRIDAAKNNYNHNVRIARAHRAFPTV